MEQITHLSLITNFGFRLAQMQIHNRTQGSTFSGAQGHMPLDFAVGPWIFQTGGSK